MNTARSVKASPQTCEREILGEMSNRSTPSPEAVDEYPTGRRVPDEPVDSGETDPRGEVDNRRWARHHLRVALAAETVDEMEYHVSMARQLLSKSLTESTGQ